MRRLNPALPPLTVRVDSGRRAFLRSANDVDVDRQGRFVAVWTEVAEDNSASIRGRRFNADGTARGPEFILDNANNARVAMNPATGDFLLIWESVSGVSLSRRILGQRFSFSSGPLGKPFQVSTAPVGDFPSPEAGCAADGACVVVWRRYPGRNRPGDVLFQRFGPDGKRRGGETLVGKTARFGGHATVAVAPQGYFVVAWAAEGGSPSARFRLFRGDGTPAGPETPITATELPASPVMDFAEDGTFVVGWTDFVGHLDDQTWEINYQRFEVPPGL